MASNFVEMEYLMHVFYLWLQYITATINFTFAWAHAQLLIIIEGSISTKFEAINYLNHLHLLMYPQSVIDIQAPPNLA